MDSIINFAPIIIGSICAIGGLFICYKKNQTTIFNTIIIVIGMIVASSATIKSFTMKGDHIALEMHQKINTNMVTRLETIEKAIENINGFITQIKQPLVSDFPPDRRNNINRFTKKLEFNIDDINKNIKEFEEIKQELLEKKRNGGN